MPSTVFVNDKLIQIGDPAVTAIDRGLTLGDGLFETVAVLGGAPQNLAAHLLRLRRGQKTLRFTETIDEAKVVSALGRLMKSNNIKDGVLRITVTRGPAVRGLVPSGAGTPSLIVTCTEGLPSEDPVSAMIATSTRRNEFSPLAGIKSLCYLDGILALMEAQASGADEALMLNSQGALAEASAANLFLVVGGELLTPRLEDGAMPGLMREIVMGALGAREERLYESDLFGSDEAFLTNSLSIRPILRVNDRAIGDGRVGTVTTNVQKLCGIPRTPD